jgi:signal peptidase I
VLCWQRRAAGLAAFPAAAAALAAFVVLDLVDLARRARRGPWRAEVAEGSMAPALLPGDWLLLDPTCRRWPRAGAIVVVREPGSGILAIKRVAARGQRAGRPDELGTPAQTPAGGGVRPLRAGEAWLEGDATGSSVDSRTYGPLDDAALVARAWFRYGPAGRIGRLHPGRRHSTAGHAAGPVETKRT